MTIFQISTIPVISNKDAPTKLTSDLKNEMAVFFLNAKYNLRDSRMNKSVLISNGIKKLT